MEKQRKTEMKQRYICFSYALFRESIWPGKYWGEEGKVQFSQEHRNGP